MDGIDDGEFRKTLAERDVVAGGLGACREDVQIGHMGNNDTPRSIST